jgi:voltage-gated potassium channel
MTGIADGRDCPQESHLAATRREALMCALALGFLVLSAVLLHRAGPAAGHPDAPWAVGWALAPLWAAILADAGIGYFRRRDYSWGASVRLLLVAVLPPYRLVVSTHATAPCVWLPLYGWQRVDQACFERLDRAFSIPMLFIALLILPILGVELFWSRYVDRYPALGLALDLGTATIWLAFALEFIVMSSLAEKKLRYLATHWINLTIIALPFLAFLRSIQFLRLARLGKVAKTLKVYRLRGLGLRAWHGMITLELVERLVHRKRESRIRYLRARLRDKEREVERLRRRLRRLEQEPEDRAGRDRAASLRDGAPGPGRRTRRG